MIGFATSVALVPTSVVVVSFVHIEVSSGKLVSCAVALFPCFPTTGTTAFSGLSFRSSARMAYRLAVGLGDMSDIRASIEALFERLFDISFDDGAFERVFMVDTGKKTANFFNRHDRSELEDRTKRGLSCPVVLQTLFFLHPIMSL